MRVLAIDPALSNMGWVIAEVSVDGKRVEMLDGGLFHTEAGADKKQRSMDDLRRAMHLAQGLQVLRADVQLAVSEIPSGAQSARASWALGVTLGVLTNVAPTPLIGVSPRQVKVAAIGDPGAAKEEIIAWAIERYPDLPWIRYRGKITLANEHMADACAVLHAGLAKPEFAEHRRVISGI